MIALYQWGANQQGLWHSSDGLVWETYREQEVPLEIVLMATIVLLGLTKARCIVQKERYGKWGQPMIL